MISRGRSHSDRSCHTPPPPHAGLPYWERALPHPGRASGQQPNLPLQALKPEPEVRVLVQSLEVRVVGKGVMAVCTRSSTEGRQWHCARAAYAGCPQQQPVAAAGQRRRQQRQLMQQCIWWAIEGGCRLRALGYAGWRLKRRGVSLCGQVWAAPFWCAAAEALACAHGGGDEQGANGALLPPRHVHQRCRAPARDGGREAGCQFLSAARFRQVRRGAAARQPLSAFVL